MEPDKLSANAGSHIYQGNSQVIVNPSGAETEILKKNLS